MTHNILLSDIDYAKRQIKENAPDAAIVAGLMSRGIESTKAAQLVDDLRHGKNATPDLQLTLRRRRRSSQPEAAAAVEQDMAAAPQSQTQEQSPMRVRREERERNPAMKARLIIGAVVFAALCLVGLALYRYRLSPEAQEQWVPAPTNARPPAGVPPKPQLPAPKASPDP